MCGFLRIQPHGTASQQHRVAYNKLERDKSPCGSASYLAFGNDQVAVRRAGTLIMAAPRPPSASTRLDSTDLGHTGRPTIFGKLARDSRTNDNTESRVVFAERALPYTDRSPACHDFYATSSAGTKAANFARSRLLVVVLTQRLAYAAACKPRRRHRNTKEHVSAKNPRHFRRPQSTWMGDGQPPDCMHVTSSLLLDGILFGYLHWAIFALRRLW